MFPYRKGVNRSHPSGPHKHTNNVQPSKHTQFVYSTTTTNRRQRAVRINFQLAIILSKGCFDWIFDCFSFFFPLPKMSNLPQRQKLLSFPQRTTTAGRGACAWCRTVEHLTLISCRTILVGNSASGASSCRQNAATQRQPETRRNHKDNSIKDRRRFDVTASSEQYQETVRVSLCCPNVWSVSRQCALPLKCQSSIFSSGWGYHSI